MSLFSTLQTGASGLGVSGQSLGVIGDNIANLNTVGYKRNRASFADMLPETVAGLGGGSQLGRGVTTVGIASQFTQGTLESTGSPLDVALAGPGWFQANDPSGAAFFTRDGTFGLDEAGYVVTPTGLRVQGFNAVDGSLSAVVGDLRLQDNPVPPQATSAISLDLVLDPETTNGIDYSALGLDGTASTIAEAAEAADFSTSITVYDSLGRTHDVVVNFERDPANPSVWSYSAVIDAGETDVAGGVAGAALEIGSGTLTFDANGDLVSNAYTATATAWTWPGAAAFAPDLALGLDPAGVPTEGSVINSGAGTGNTLSSISQDGYPVGNLASVEVNEEGIVMGRYTNGEEIPLGQVAVALFDAEGGLERLGGNLFRSTSISGDPAMGRPGAGGRGAAVGYALERSNVDLEGEFVDMIRAQRSFQANAGVIRTADETLQELVNLV